MRITSKAVKDRAERLGLYAYDNNFDGLHRWQIYQCRADKESREPLYRASSNPEAWAYLAGYYNGRESLREAAIQANTAIEATRKGERSGAAFGALSFAGDKLCAALGIVRN